MITKPPPTRLVSPTLLSSHHLVSLLVALLLWPNMITFPSPVGTHEHPLFLKNDFPRDVVKGPASENLSTILHSTHPSPFLPSSPRDLGACLHPRPLNVQNVALYLGQSAPRRRHPRRLFDLPPSTS
ncbi:hypothetical protein EDB86DRAFT_2906398 [Lactarius hatsudake]|nr:hypothetical protein EDB86DRAFT_2906398 [Lactarius hatsudake]